MLDLLLRLTRDRGESRKAVRLEEGRLLRQGRKSLARQWLWLVRSQGNGTLARQGLRVEVVWRWHGAPERVL